MNIVDHRCVRRIVVRILAVGFATMGLLLLAAGLWRWRLHWQVESRLRTLRQAGLPTSGAELNRWHADVPDRENAALVMTQAFALLRSFPDSRSNTIGRVILPGRGGCPESELIELVSDYIQINAPALAKARDAVAMPRCRYPEDYGRESGLLFPHLARLKHLALLAEMEGQVAIQHGQSTAALDSSALVLKLARTLDDEPLVVSQLVRLALIHIALRSLERTLALTELEPEPLARISNALAVSERTNLFQRAFVGERAMNLSVIQNMAARADRDARNEMPPLVRELQDGLLGSDFDPGIPFERATGMTDRLTLERLLQAESEILAAGLPWPQRLAATNLSGLNRDAALIGLSREATALARLRAAQVAVAVERFRVTIGRIPTALSELVPQFLASVPVDPFDGNPVRYRQLQKGYVVYSIGADGRDDHGKERPTRWPNGGLAPEHRKGRGYGMAVPIRTNGTNWPEPARVVPPEDITFIIER